jgi:hypothetical protein
MRTIRVRRLRRWPGRDPTAPTRTDHPLRSRSRPRPGRSRARRPRRPRQRPDVKTRARRRRIRRPGWHPGRPPTSPASTGRSPHRRRCMVRNARIPRRVVRLRRPGWRLGRLPKGTTPVGHQPPRRRHRRQTPLVGESQGTVRFPHRPWRRLPRWPSREPKGLTRRDRPSPRRKPRLEPERARPRPSGIWMRSGLIRRPGRGPTGLMRMERSPRR